MYDQTSANRTLLPPQEVGPQYVILHRVYFFAKRIGLETRATILHYFNLYIVELTNYFIIFDFAYAITGRLKS